MTPTTGPMVADLDGLETAIADVEKIAAHVGVRQAIVLFDAVNRTRALIALARRAVGEGGEDAEAIVTRWANWIIDQSADFDDVTDHDAGRRKVLAERDLILAAIRSPE